MKNSKPDYSRAIHRGQPHGIIKKAEKDIEKATNFPIKKEKSTSYPQK